MLIADEVASLVYHGDSGQHAPSNNGNGVTAATAVWIATATLHKQHPMRSIFSKKDIFDKVLEQGLFDKDDATVSIHISEQCVANIKAQPGKHRKVYRVSRGRYRLYRDGDDYHSTRKHGKAEPSVDELPDKYKDLLDWYYKEYCKK